jgi:hypothetical protein
MTQQRLALVKRSSNASPLPTPPSSELPALPWQPLDPIAQEWAVLVLCAQSVAAYTAAGHALLALSWEESARVQYAAACGLRKAGATSALVAQLAQVVRDLAQAWREWQATASWMHSGHIRLRPAEAREHRHLPSAERSSAELIQVLEQSATTQQARLVTLSVAVEQEYATLCQQYSLPRDRSLRALLLSLSSRSSLEQPSPPRQVHP